MSHAEPRGASRAAAGRREQVAGGAKLYAILVFSLALALIGIGHMVAVSRGHSLSTADLPSFLVLLFIGTVSVLLRETNTGAEVSLSFTNVVIVAAAPLVGPAGAGVIGLAIQFAAYDELPISRFFNAGMTSAIASLGGLAYVLVGGQVNVARASAATLIVSVGIPLVVANLVTALANLVILAGMVQVSSGQARRFLTGAFGQSLPTYLGYSIICFVFVVLWVPAGVGPLSAVLIMAPLLVARWVLVQYGEEVRAHNRVLATLVTAAEGADRADTGHGARVDALCARVAARLRLSEQMSRSLHYAATLHDIGRIGLPARTLTVAAREAEEADLDSLRRHPEIAELMVRDISFLQEAAIAIRHHHERVDGRGYPDGLVADEIPLLARIVAVVDAFDALTVPLGHHPPIGVADALAHLRRLAGTQLDGRVVEVLAQVVEDDGWEPGPLPARRLEDSLWWDHDDPFVSELTARASSPGPATAGPDGGSHRPAVTIRTAGSAVPGVPGEGR